MIRLQQPDGIIIMNCPPLRPADSGKFTRIHISPSKLNRDGNHDIKVGFAEPRSDGGSNAKLANILEYGKHGQPAKPFLKPAKTASRQECIDAMTKALDEEVEKL